MALKRQREDIDEKLTEKSASNDEDELACKKKRLNEETNEFSIEAVKCRICLDVVTCPTMRSLPCAHAFHENCLYQWLEISIVCPLCKWPTTRQNSGNYEDGNGYQYEDDDYSSGESSDEYLAVGFWRASSSSGSSRDSPPSGSKDESQTSGSSSDSPPSGSRNESPPSGSRNEFQPSGSRNESPPSGSRYESPPSGSRYESQPSGSRYESQPSGPNREFPPDEPRNESSSSRSNRESRPSGSSVGSAPVESRGGPRRLNVLDLYSLYVWSDDSDYEDWNEGEEY